MRMPHVVAREQWQAARDELLVKEKQLIADDWLAAARRRLHDEYSTVRARDEITSFLGMWALRLCYGGFG